MFDLKTVEGRESSVSLVLALQEDMILTLTETIRAEDALRGEGVKSRNPAYVEYIHFDTGSTPEATELICTMSDCWVTNPLPLISYTNPAAYLATVVQEINDREARKQELLDLEREKGRAERLSLYRSLKEEFDPTN